MMGVCLRRFCLNISVVGDILFCSEFGQGTTGCIGECCFAVMYGEWYGVCDVVVLSGHQTNVFHLSRHFFAILLKLLRSSNKQGRARRVHCIIYAVCSVARPHSHVAFPSKYPHFCMCFAACESCTYSI